MDLVLYILLIPSACLVLFIMYLIIENWVLTIKVNKRRKNRIKLEQKIRAGKYPRDTFNEGKLLEEEYKEAYFEYYGKEPNRIRD